MNRGTIEYVIKIYVAKRKKPFAEIVVDNDKYFDELYEKISSCYDGLKQVKRYVEFYQVIFDIQKFDHAELIIK